MDRAEAKRSAFIAPKEVFVGWEKSNFVVQDVRELKRVHTDVFAM